MEGNETIDGFEQIETPEDSTADQELGEKIGDDGSDQNDEPSPPVEDYQLIIDSVSANQVTLEQIVSKSDAIKEELDTVKAQTVETRETGVDYSETLGDIATMLSYQNLLLMVIGCYVVLSIGVKLGSFLFSYFRDK